MLQPVFRLGERVAVGKCLRPRVVLVVMGLLAKVGHRVGVQRHIGVHLHAVHSEGREVVGIGQRQQKHAVVGCVGITIGLRYQGAALIASDHEGDLRVHATGLVADGPHERVAGFVGQRGELVDVRELIQIQLIPDGVVQGRHVIDEHAALVGLALQTVGLAGLVVDSTGVFLMCRGHRTSILGPGHNLLGPHTAPAVALAGHAEGVAQVVDDGIGVGGQVLRLDAVHHVVVLVPHGRRPLVGHCGVPFKIRLDEGDGAGLGGAVVHIAGLDVLAACIFGGHVVVDIVRAAHLHRGAGVLGNVADELHLELGALEVLAHLAAAVRPAIAQREGASETIGIVGTVIPVLRRNATVAVVDDVPFLEDVGVGHQHQAHRVVVAHRSVHGIVHVLAADLLIGVGRHDGAGGLLFI